MVTCELPETSACGTTGDGRRHESVYAASPFSLCLAKTSYTYKMNDLAQTSIRTFPI